MAAIWVLLSLVVFASAQVVVPEKGWRKTGGGREVGEMRPLGIWDNTDNGKGDVMIGAAWGQKPPTIREFLGLAPGEVASGDLIQSAEMLEKPRLGMMVQYRNRKVQQWSHYRTYWIYGKDGGVLLNAIHDKDAEFSLVGWNAEGTPEDENGKKQTELEEIVKELNATKALPIIKTKPKADPVSGFVVKIGKDGSFSVDGENRDEEALLKLMKAAVEAEPKEAVLVIRAAKGIEFTMVRRLIRLGAKAGIEQVAYRSFEED